MNDVLEHHGIKGMKWGVIRTPAQLGHVTKSKRPPTDSAKKQSTVKQSSPRKKLSKLTDDELRQRITRLNMEEQYDNLVERAKTRNTSTLKKLAIKSLESFGQQSFDIAVKWAVDKIFNTKDPNEALRKEVERLRLEEQQDDLREARSDSNKKLKRDIDRLSLEDRRSELLSKKDARENPKFDINKWRDADVRTMDAETAKEVARWYTNAKLIATGRDALKPKSDGDDE